MHLPAGQLEALYEGFKGCKKGQLLVLAHPAGISLYSSGRFTAIRNRDTAPTFSSSNSSPTTSCTPSIGWTVAINCRRKESARVLMAVVCVAYRRCAAASAAFACTWHCCAGSSGVTSSPP
eukprot:GHUV01016489.1.p2 GENE.GHUV01016489.1~~GHUV01016489.1.p2  ORF type:complete len:121 (+),score=23.53 GHUV01016489.1:1116-1478(+)